MGLDPKKSILKAGNNESVYTEKYQCSDLYEVIVEDQTTCYLPTLEATGPNSGENLGSTTDKSFISQNDSSGDVSQNCNNNVNRSSYNNDLKTLCLQMETADSSSDEKLMAQNSPLENDSCEKSSQNLKAEKDNVSSEVLHKYNKSEKTVHWREPLEETVCYYSTSTNQSEISVSFYCDCADENCYRFIGFVLLIGFFVLTWFLKSSFDDF